MATKKTIKKTAPKQNALISALTTGDIKTHNGAVSHSTTGTSLLDFFGKGGSMRSQPDDASITLFRSAYNEDKTIALKILFYLVDVREGQGERKLFRNCFKWLAQNDEKVAKNLLIQIPEFTRWDNVLETLEGTSLEKIALKFVADKLIEDASEKNPSLCAKWAPSEQASSSVTKRLAKKVRTTLDYSPKQYRKLLSALRKKIDVVERKMCVGEWDKINYPAVPSKAASTYRKAFKEHDGDRYSKFLTNVEKGEEKINASVLYPYDIVRSVRNIRSVDRTLEAQWKALPDYLAGNKHNGIVVADVSASMDSCNYYNANIGNNIAPIDVAVSIAIYFAERNEGAFKDHFMIFSHNAKLLKITGTSLIQNVTDVLGRREVANTNLQSVFDLILDKGVSNKVPQSEMPSHVYIISDMQFDCATGPDSLNSGEVTNHAAIKAKYAAAGYNVPQIVYWNVNSYSDVPVKYDDKGTCLVSGCSPSILKSVLSNKSTTPYNMMIDTVCSDRYEVIKA
jgi:hypothetical protein